MSEESNIESIKFEKFIEKSNFNNLFWCITLVAAATELFKMIFPYFEPRALVLIFSVLVSYSKSYLNNGLTKENFKEKMLIAFFNIVPIAIGAIGAYDMVLRVILKAFMEKGV